MKALIGCVYSEKQGVWSEHSASDNWSSPTVHHAKMSISKVYYKYTIYLHNYSRSAL